MKECSEKSEPTSALVDTKKSVCIVCVIVIQPVGWPALVRQVYPAANFCSWSRREEGLQQG